MITDYTNKGTVKPPLGLLPRSDHPHRKGLVGQWIMNEGSGLFLNDMSGNGNAGTVVGAGWGIGGVDCTGGGIDYSALPTALSSPYSLVFTFKAPGTASGQYIFDCDNGPLFIYPESSLIYMAQIQWYI